MSLPALDTDADTSGGLDRGPAANGHQGRNQAQVDDGRRGRDPHDCHQERQEARQNRGGNHAPHQDDRGADRGQVPAFLAFRVEPYDPPPQARPRRHRTHQQTKAAPLTPTGRAAVTDAAGGASDPS
ncbi:hypothetical protein PBRA_001100 [Plasmodiophora brassicae]|uniref:Uncharacterized protein n=1 Tax=Plasmodiophora brassicae TaxID=37360 RepID=A0A0G4IV49_PLABS|nr:hypothetical protein PBRA_001100 [Plasmodiophora brassicae]